MCSWYFARSDGTNRKSLTPSSSSSTATRCPAEREGGHGALVGEAAAVIEAHAARSEPGDQDAVDPALGDGGVENQNSGKFRIIRSHQSSLPISAWMSAQTARLVAVPLLEGIDEVVGILALPELGRTRHRVETHLIQIGDPDLVPNRLQVRGGRVAQRRAKRLRFRMRMNDEHVHAPTSVRCRLNRRATLRRPKPGSQFRQRVAAWLRHRRSPSSRGRSASSRRAPCPDRRSTRARRCR